MRSRGPAPGTRAGAGTVKGAGLCIPPDVADRTYPAAGNSVGGIGGSGSSCRSDARRFSSRSDVSHGHRSGSCCRGHASRCSMRHRCSATGGATAYTVTVPSTSVIHRCSGGTVCTNGSMPGSSITQSRSWVATRSCGSPQYGHVNVVVLSRAKPSSAPMHRACAAEQIWRESANRTGRQRRPRRRTVRDGSAGVICMHKPHCGRPRSYPPGDGWARTSMGGCSVAGTSGIRIDGIPR